MSGHAQYNLTSSDGTTAQAAVGQQINVKGAVWQYTKASAAIVIYQLCQLDNSGFCAACTTTTAAAIPTGAGPAQFAVAVSEYFWLPVGPFRIREDGATTFKVLGAASCVLDVALYTTGTAGVVDDSSTVLVAGLHITTTLTGAASVGCIAHRAIGLVN